MADFKKMYFKMFNAASGAIEALRDGRDGAALRGLIAAQRECEDLFIETEPDIAVERRPIVIEIPPRGGKK